MGFFKQNGPLQRDFCEVLLYVVALWAIEASKPSGYPDGESMRWNVVLLPQHFFAIVFRRNSFQISSDTNHFVAWKRNTRQCQSNNISGTSEICAVRKVKKCCY